MLGRNVWRRLRRELGFTQKTFAACMGITPATLARWELDESSIAELAAQFLRLLARTEGKRSRRRA